MIRLSSKAEAFKVQLASANRGAEEPKDNAILAEEEVAKKERVATAAVLCEWFSDAPEIPEDVIITEKKVEVDGQLVNLRIYRLRSMNSDELHPVTLYHTAGGLVNDMQKEQDNPCALLCKSSNSMVISIQPPLAPECKLPQIADIVYKLTRKIFSEAEDYGADRDAIAISGYSMGGNLALLTALDAVRNDLPLTAVVLISGQLDVSLSVRRDIRYNEGADLDFLAPVEMQEKFANFFLPSGADAKSPEYSPLFSDLRKPPCVELIAGDCDALMPDMRAMEEKCREQDVPVNLIIVHGTVHNAFFMWHLLGNDSDHMAILIGERLKTRHTMFSKS